jgi:glycine cleavage system regulatory protein
VIVAEGHDRRFGTMPRRISCSASRRRRDVTRFDRIEELRSSRMKATLVLTLIGVDRPGLVKEISNVATKHGANWEASRMARLGGRFAGLLQVSLEPSRAEALRRELEALSDHGLRVVVEESVTAAPRSAFQTYKLELLGTDRIGITHRVAQTLAELGINVDELSTECTSAPISGGELFKLSATLACPPSVGLERLRAELERVEDDLMVDIDIDPSERGS